MTDSEGSRIKNIWEKEGKKKKLIPPEVPLAVDKNGEQYFVYEDHSTILRIFLNKSNIAFVVPKKYTSLIKTEDGDKYLITDIFELHPISCPKKNQYQQFVMEYLVT